MSSAPARKSPPPPAMCDSPSPPTAPPKHTAGLPRWGAGFDKERERPETSTMRWWLGEEMKPSACAVSGPVPNALHPYPLWLANAGPTHTSGSEETQKKTIISNQIRCASWGIQLERVYCIVHPDQSGCEPVRRLGAAGKARCSCFPTTPFAPETGTAFETPIRCCSGTGSRPTKRTRRTSPLHSSTPRKLPSANKDRPSHPSQPARDSEQLDRRQARAGASWAARTGTRERASQVSHHADSEGRGEIGRHHLDALGRLQTPSAVAVDRA